MNLNSTKEKKIVHLNWQKLVIKFVSVDSPVLNLDLSSF